ncbi:MAG: tetratricopeptide repeat protein [Deltaproteobacteria bacterium]|jgi:tetratricopeptide (TPR) repeat protein|nr:tetratricopeptide repeat protein [Deltaproteobacteria bacterium]
MDDDSSISYAESRMKGLQGDLSVRPGGDGPEAVAAELLRLLEKSFREKGPDHPDTLALEVELGGAMGMAGDPAGALEHSQRALDVLERVLGPEDSLTMNAADVTGAVLVMSGRHVEAAELFLKSLRARRSCLGPDHPRAVASQIHLGESLMLESELEQALSLLSDAYGRSVRTRGADNPDALRCALTLGQTLLALLRPDEAAEMLGTAHRGMARSRGHMDANTVIAAARLAEAIRDSGGGARIMEVLSVPYLEIRREFGPDHLRVAEAADGLGRALVEAGFSGLALDMIWEAYRVRLKALGPDHLWTALSAGNLGIAIAPVFGPDTAAGLLTRCLDVMTDHLGPDHRETVKIRERLRDCLESQGSWTGPYEGSGHWDAIPGPGLVSGCSGESGPGGGFGDPGGFWGLGDPRDFAGFRSLAGAFRGELGHPWQDASGGPDDLPAIGGIAPGGLGDYVIGGPGDPDRPGADEWDVEAMLNRPADLGDFTLEDMSGGPGEGSGKVFAHGHDSRKDSIGETAFSGRAGYEELVSRLGREHPQTMAALAFHTQTLRDMGDGEGAERLIARESDAILAKNGPDSPDGYRHLANLAGFLEQITGPAPARETAERAVAGLRRILGHGHWDTLRASHRLGLMLAALHEPAAAREILQQALASGVEALATGHPDVREISKALETLGRGGDA